MSSRLLSTNFKIKIYKTILSVVLYGCEAWSVTLREESRIRIFESRNLRRIFRPREMQMGSVEGSTMRNFMVCTIYLIQSGRIRRSLRWAGHVGRSDFKMLQEGDL